MKKSKNMKELLDEKNTKWTTGTIYQYLETSFYYKDMVEDLLQILSF